MSNEWIDFLKSAGDFLGPLLGTLIGVIGGSKIRDYRLSQLEKKQSEMSTKQEADESEIGEVKITITAMNGRLVSHEKRLDKNEKSIEKLQSLHMQE